MLYFCSVQDIQTVIPSATRFDGPYEDVRASVTQDMNEFLRRNLEFKQGVVEYFDSFNVGVYNDTILWLDKKAIKPASLIVTYSPTREFDEVDNVIDPTRIQLDPDTGKLIIAGPFTRAARSIKVTYDGGYPAMPVEPATDPVTYTDVMDCPVALKSAAIAESSYRLDKLLNKNVGNKEDLQKNQRVAQTAFVGSLLRTTAMSITRFKKPLG